ncbi:energy transducer TonB family protein [Tardiphaga robiniae]|uniref:TonB C-terminal domain-containing protein n=1 Tax=Tardiphaga robiniae TaxID=943830 RepID=A0A163XCX1_9BRAD|nr:hypothetical protein A4A58_18630 [Tardiphaga robiniae]
MQAWKQRTNARIARAANRLADGAPHAHIVVGFVVNRSGRIIEMGIVQSSGNPYIDGAALAVIRMAGPFSPLPSSYTGQILPLVQAINFVHRQPDRPARRGR